MVSVGVLWTSCMNGCFNIDLIGATLVPLNKVKKAPCVCVCVREREREAGFFG